MKTKSIIAMSLMAALAVGCSSDDIVDDGTKNPGTAEGRSYVSLNITLPSLNGTKATEESFDHGDANEYNVGSVKITFYENTGTEASPSYTEIEGQDPIIYNSDDLAWAGSTVQGITTTALLPVRQVTFSDAVDAYALVEVNPITTDENLNDWNVNVTNEASSKITVEKLIGTDKNAFFMTNAVKHDGSYLVKVKSYKSELEAQNNAHNYNVYVERAVAKATLKVAEGENWGSAEGTKTTYTITEDGVYKGAMVKIDTWKLDVTNKKMYPIRKFAGTGSFPADNYERFYGAATYRTYWAEDPNYSDYNKDNVTENFNVISATTDITNAVGSNEYCLENTFNTRHQKQNETTRVVVKAIYTPKFEEGEKTAEDGATWYTIGNSTKAYTKSMLQAAIKDVLDIENDVTLSELESGDTTIGSTTFNVGANAATEDAVTKVKNALGSKITTYKNGECYYGIRIKHFGDLVCPWGAPNYDNYLDGNKEKEYLGRYGVVRNNWYQVTINTVSQPGEPTIPELTEEQDDVQKYYLQAEIHILDWAVRTQGVDL